MPPFWRKLGTPSLVQLPGALVSAWPPKFQTSIFLGMLNVNWYLLPWKVSVFIASFVIFLPLIRWLLTTKWVTIGSLKEGVVSICISCCLFLYNVRLRRKTQTSQALPHPSLQEGLGTVDARCSCMGKDIPATQLNFLNTRKGRDIFTQFLYL